MISHTSKYSALTDEQLKLLGTITVEWSNVEFLLGTMLSRLLYTPEFLSRTYTSSMSAYKIIEAIREGLDIHKYRYSHKTINAEISEKINRVVSEADKLRAIRNRVSHFCWSRSHENEVFGIKFSGGVPSSKKERKEVSTLSNKELSEIGTEIHGVVEDLMILVQELPEIEEVAAIRLINKA